jgi:hypothetical protein
MEPYQVSSYTSSIDQALVFPRVSNRFSDLLLKSHLIVIHLIVIMIIVRRFHLLNFCQSR